MKKSSTQKSAAIAHTTVAEFRAALAALCAQRNAAIHPGTPLDVVPATHASEGVNAPGQRLRIGFVPTMGALHEGHAHLVRAAAETADIVIASVFVNPLQFDQEEDYQLYPRDWRNDVGLLSDSGVDLIFAPDVRTMYPGYPDRPQLRVDTGKLGRRLEGAHRPGHFDGVATVVNKLINIASTGAQAQLDMWFGEKDFEQVAVVRALVADMNQPVRIRTLPTQRDAEGLALSSRNQRLSPQEYQRALMIPRTLHQLQRRTELALKLDLEQLRDQLTKTPGVHLDYLEIVDPATLEPLADDAAHSPHLNPPHLNPPHLNPPHLNPAHLDRTAPHTPHLSGGMLVGTARALIAARVGSVRLIDNIALGGTANHVISAT